MDENTIQAVMQAQNEALTGDIHIPKAMQGPKGKPIFTPNFPGQQKGFSIGAIRRMIKRQKRAVARRIDIPAGDAAFPINISGSARIFLGFSLINPPAGLLQMLINDEIIINPANAAFFVFNAASERDYYDFPRPLSGNDAFEFIFTGVAAGIQTDIIIYYI